MNINIVISRYNKNVDFINKLKNEVKNPYNIPVNKGQEASVYLKYIIDFYHNLPEFTFFMHDDEYAWHHSGSILDKFYEAVYEITKDNVLYYNINDKCVMGIMKY